MKKSAALIIVSVFVVLFLLSCASSAELIADDALPGRWEYRDLYGKVWVLDIFSSGTNMSMLSGDIDDPFSIDGKTYHSAELIWKEPNQFGVIRFLSPDDDQVHFIEFILYKYNMSVVMNLVGTSTDFPVLKDYHKAK